jgi:hypothetical protein
MHRLPKGARLAGCGKRVLVPAGGRPTPTVVRAGDHILGGPAAGHARVAQSQGLHGTANLQHHPDFTQTRGWKAVQKEKLLGRERWQDEVDRGPPTPHAWGPARPGPPGPPAAVAPGQAV